MTTVITERSIVITARDAAYLIAGIELDAVARRRDRVTIPSDITDTFDRIVVEGAGYNNRHRAARSPANAEADTHSFVGGQWTQTTVKAASLSLSRTPQAVRAMLRREHLHGDREPDGRTWRVCEDDVTARMKGKRCNHI